MLTRGRRLKPEVRVELITKTATRFFATHGLDRSTAELAKAIGMTQPLLYRYFPNKLALIHRVWEDAMGDAFVKKHVQHWLELLEARDVSPEERLINLYQSYFTRALTYDRVRLYLRVALSAEPAANASYLAVIQEVLFPRIVQLIRLAWAPHVPATDPISTHELAAVQALHGSVFYIAVRKWVHWPALVGDSRETIRLYVKMFFMGARVLYVKQFDAVHSESRKRKGPSANSQTKRRRNRLASVRPHKLLAP